MMSRIEAKEKRVVELHPLNEVNADLRNVQITVDSPNFNTINIMIPTERWREALRDLGVAGIPIFLKIVERTEVPVARGFGHSDNKENTQKWSLYIREDTNYGIKKVDIYISLFFEKGEFSDVEELVIYLDSEIRNVFRKLSIQPFMNAFSHLSSNTGSLLILSIARRYRYLWGRLTNNRGEFFIYDKSQVLQSEKSSDS